MNIFDWLIGRFGLTRTQQQPPQAARPVSPPQDTDREQAVCDAVHGPRPGITFASRSFEHVNGMPLPQLGECSMVEESEVGHVQETISHQRVTLGDGSLAASLTDEMFCCSECLADIASIEGVQNPQARLPQTFWPNMVAVRLMSGRLVCPNHAILIGQDPVTGAALYMSPRELTAMQDQHASPMLSRLKQLLLGG